MGMVCERSNQVVRVVSVVSRRQELRLSCGNQHPLPGTTGFDKPTIPVFPDVYICMNCGLAEYKVSEAELERLTSSE